MCSVCVCMGVMCICLVNADFIQNNTASEVRTKKITHSVFETKPQKMATDCGDDCFKVIAIAGGGFLVLLGFGVCIMAMCRRRRDKALEHQNDPSNDGANPTAAPASNA